MAHVDTRSAIPLMSDLRKRKRSDSEDGNLNKHSYYVVLASESEHSTDDGSESIWSVQEKETDTAKDTSDTCTKSDVSSASEREFSPIPFSDTVDLCDNTDSSSSSDHALTMFSQSTARKETKEILEDNVSWADSSDSKGSSHFDSEIPKADYWQCARCHCKNNAPLFRYCDKCYQRRKSEVPPRPQHKKKRTKAANISKAKQLPSLDTQRLLLKLSEPGPSSASQNLFSSQETLTSFSSQDTFPSQSSGYSSEKSNVGMCQVCEEEPQNAGFLHLKLVHVWGCYKCAKKVWRQFKRCPLCNDKSRVIKVIF